MRFTHTLLLSLASTSLAVVLPRSNLGSWAVSVSRAAYANGYESQDVVATFTSESYPEGIKSSCRYVRSPATTPAETSSCDNDAFEYDYDGQTIKLQQVIDLPTKQTVFGNAPLKLSTSDAVGRTFSGEATVEVTSAIA